jgi:hypothetical protein
MLHLRKPLDTNSLEALKVEQIKAFGPVRARNSETLVELKAIHVPFVTSPQSET